MREPKIFKKIYNNLLRERRIKFVADKIGWLAGQTILDIGCQDCLLKKYLNLDYTGIDLIKTKKCVIKGDIERIKINKKYDIVLCLETLEHLKDPVAVMNKIKSIANKYIVISVPNEPYYTFSRFLIPCGEHYWTITPNLLKIHFGKPLREYYYNFKRHYIGIFKGGEDKR